jgi:hypothetical protein
MQGESGMPSSATAQRRVFIGPGLSRFRLGGTIVGLILIAGFVLWIALRQAEQGAIATAIVGTISALLFILGFVYYLLIVAPVPFTLVLENEALVKRSQKGEVITIPWEDLTRIKEEFFPNGTRISISAYRNVTEEGQKAKAWVVYRNDVDDLDRLSEALKRTIPETCTWESKTVHD